MKYIACLLILVVTCHAQGQQNCSDDCSKALGMEDDRIKNSQIIGGFAYNGDKTNFGSQNARLHHPRGFRAEPKRFPPSANTIGIHFAEEKIITAIATQGYDGEWVNSFNVFYTDLLGNQRSVKDIEGQPLDFPGNTDSETVKRNSLPIPVFASSVFILPLTVHKNVGLRLELYGCEEGHYFIVWLMLKETFFTVTYTDPSTWEYQDAVTNALDEVNRILGTTWGFLHAHVRELSPRESPSFSTAVTAIVEIHCLRSSEQALLTKLKSVMGNNYEGIFDPGFFRSQYPKRCGCAPPKASVGLGKMMKDAKEFFLSKMMKLPLQLEHSCQPTTTILYSWKFSKIDKETGLFGPLQPFGRKDTFKLPLHMFGIGYAYVQCEVQLSGDATSLTLANGYMRIVRDPLVADITDITETRSKITLSAEKSFDAGRRRYGTRGLQFTWFCRLAGESFLDVNERYAVNESFGGVQANTGCFGYGPGRLTSTDEVLVLNMAEMVESKKYIFKLVIYKDNRNASAEYELEVKPLASIFVSCLSNCGEKVSPQDGLLLEVTCQGEACSKISNCTWSLHIVNQSVDGFSVSPVHHVKMYVQMNTRRLLIDDIFKLQDDTRKHVHYTVKSSVKLDDGKEYDGHFSFIVNSPPKKFSVDASCHVVPMEGEAISTEFSITCSGWHDADKPLTYEFTYRDKYGMVMIQVGSLNTVTTKLPVGEASNEYNLPLEVLVGDSYQDFTSTRLLVKVHPPKQSDFDDDFVNKQLNVIRDFVQAGDADRATELAFMLMSTVKDFPDQSFERKSSSILRDMKGLKVKSVVHVTKVAAVVVWATDNSQTVSRSLQADAFELLSEATNFMASQFSSNSTHDAKVAKNVSSVLLNGIGSLLQISSMDARIETKDDLTKETGKKNTKRTLELVRKVGEVLSSASHSSQGKTVVKSNFVNIAIYKEKPDDLSGRNISEGGTDIDIPDSKNIFPKTNDSVTLQLMEFKENPYTWDKTASSIRSTVIDVTLKTSKGVEVDVNNLSSPLGLHIPSIHAEKVSHRRKKPRHLFLQPGVIRYHTLVIPSIEHIVALRVANAASRQMVVYFGQGFKPRADNNSYVVKMPDLSFCQSHDTYKIINCTDDAYSVKLTGYDAGLYYIGITLVVQKTRMRKSCTGTDRRKKRSCIQVKDPPTTPPPTPMIVTPQYNATTDVNYTFSVTMGTCLYWSEEEEKWSSRGCRIGSGSKQGRVHCLCTHLTSFGGDFFVAPNPIDFEKVWSEFGRLGETGNYVVLVTVCTMLGFYVVGLIFARRADKKDDSKVIAEYHLSDPQTGEHTYSISIQTGAWRNSGTTANVGLVLYGEEGVSKPIIFACKQLESTFFARGSVNTFTLYLQKSLGSLFKLNVWHDNSGDSPSWFLLEIVVEDVQTREKWNFIANRWLAVEKGLGEIELELRAASKADLLELKNVLHSRAQKAVGDSHLWISLFTKPPHNQFTRCQRLSCCLSVIFCAMVTGAMFYRFGVKATDVFHIGPLKFSWTEIKIGIQSGLVAVPVNFLIVTIFKNIKQSREQSYASGCLPHIFLYFSWGLCISTMLVSAVFTVFYSLSWGAEISNQWFVSMTFSFFEDVLLIQPMKVLFIVCLMSIIIRKPLDPDSVCHSQILPEHQSARTGDFGKEARILEIEELENARSQRKKEIKALRAIVEICFFTTFLVLFMVVCYGNRDSARYSLTKSVQAIFKDFSKVDDTPSLWSWMRNAFVPELFNTAWYNGKPFDYDEGFISNRENFLVGMPRLRQIRILPESKCNSKSQSLGLVLPRCLPFYSESNEDTTPFHKPGWIPVKNASLTITNTAELDSLCPKPWQYVTSSGLKSEPIQGTTTAYLGGGFVANLGYNSESALDVIQSLEENRWIDDRTVAVLIECTLFEPVTSFYSFMRYLYEKFPTGGVITSGAVKTVTVYLPNGSESYRWFYQVSQVLLVLVILAFVIIEIVKAFRVGRIYFKRFWSWIDILLICFAASGIGIMLYKEGCTREYVSNVRENPFDNWGADQIIFWSEVEDYLLSGVMFVVTIKSLRLFRFNPHIYQMRTTLRDSVTPLSSFAVVFLVVIIAFSLFAFLSFGSSVLNYSTLPQAVRTLLQMSIGGKSSYYQLKFATDSFLGPLFLFAYLITAMAILVNTFIAILNESYTMSREEKEGAKNADDIDYVDLLQYLQSCVKASIRSCYNFGEFVRLSLCNRTQSRKYQVNGYHVAHAPETNVPRLASMDSLDEIQDPILSHAEELLSKVQLHLRKLSEGTIQEISETDQDTDQEGSCSDSELELKSDCGSFLEENFCYSSTTSTLIFDGNYLYDRLSVSDISDTSV